MSILGGMGNTENKQQIYLGFKTMGQKFYANGETEVDVKYLQLDPETFKSGWGRYTTRLHEARNSVKCMQPVDHSSSNHVKNVPTGAQ